MRSPQFIFVCLFAGLLGAASPAWALRIISLLPSNTEIADALGVSGEVVGITVYDAPRANRQSVGDLANPNLEAIVSLQPDIVLAGLWKTSRVVSRLRAMGYSVIEVPNPHSFEDIYGDIRQVAQAIHRPADAERVIRSMRERLAAVEQKAHGRPRVRLYIEIDRGWWTPGGPDFITDAVRAAGGENIFSDVLKEAAQVSPEAVLLRNPDAVLCLESSRAEFSSRSSMRDLRAVRDGRVIDDLPPNTLNRPSPLLVDGVERLAERLASLEKK
jgi:iron complex transport system substrate-binding protein